MITYPQAEQALRDVTALLESQAARLNFLEKRIAPYPMDEIRPIVEARVTNTPDDQKLDGSVQWKWRQDGPPVEWDWTLAMTALLECLIVQGGNISWDGDGTSCAVQMMHEIHRRWRAAEAKVAQLEQELLDRYQEAQDQDEYDNMYIG